MGGRLIGVLLYEKGCESKDLTVSLKTARLIRADLNEFLYNVNKDGSSLLQLAVNGGSKQVNEKIVF